jgi:hypothetical protein
MASEHHVKCPRVGIEPSTNLPGWCIPTQVISDHYGKDGYFACASGKMEYFTGLGDLSRSYGGTPSSHGGAGPPLKKALTKNCLSSSARYVCEGSCILVCDLPILVSSRTSKFGDF